LQFIPDIQAEILRQKLMLLKSWKLPVTFVPPFALFFLMKLLENHSYGTLV